MFAWIASHIGTILICAILICIVAFIIVGIVRDKKKGKSPCCGNCKGCSMAGSCHSIEQKKK